MTSIGRREAIAGAVLAGVGAATVVEGGNPQDDVVLGQIRDDLRALLRQLATPPPEVVQVRNVQHTFLRAAGEYPAFIEVGVRYFDAVHDWLRQSPHRLEISRMADGRYGLRFDFTMLVLRPDAQPDYLGPASDGR